MARPPAVAYWGTHSRAWTHVKYVWQLTTTDTEKNALATMLDTCLQ